MAGFKVTEQELATLSGDITKANDHLRGHIGRLNGVIEQIAGGWKGEAATAYHRLQERWNQDAKKMSDLLMDMKEAIDSSRKNYNAQEQAQNAEISKILADFG